MNELSASATLELKSIIAQLIVNLAHCPFFQALPFRRYEQEGIENHMAQCQYCRPKARTAIERMAYLITREAGR